jgi:hypothetical protein
MALVEEGGLSGRKGSAGVGNVTKSWHIRGTRSLCRSVLRWRILQAFFVRSLPHSGSHLSPMRSRSDLLRGYLRTGSPARAAERGSAALSGNSARSRHARGAEPSLSRPTAMRDGSWSLRSARRTLRAPCQHGIDRTASQRNRTWAGALPSLPPIGVGVSAPLIPISSSRRPPISPSTLVTGHTARPGPTIASMGNGNQKRPFIAKILAAIHKRFYEAGNISPRKAGRASLIVGISRFPEQPRPDGILDA